VDEGGQLDLARLHDLALVAWIPAPHEEDPVALGVGEPEVDVGPATGPHRLDRVLDARGRGLDVLVEHAELLPADLEDELVLVGEMQVDRGRGDTHGVGDAPNRHGRLVAGLEQQAGGGHQDVGTQPLSLAAPGPCPSG